MVPQCHQVQHVCILKQIQHALKAIVTAQEKMTLGSPGDLVIYRSRLNTRINRNFPGLQLSTQIEAKNGRPRRLTPHLPSATIVP